MSGWKPYDWLAIIVVVLVCFAGVVMVSPVERSSKRTDAFLDQPLPLGFVPHPSYNLPPASPPPKTDPNMEEVSYLSYQERLDALKKVSPRPLVLPEGLSEFIAKVDGRSRWDEGDILFANERDGMGGYGKTIRDFMSTSLKMMGLTFKYDPNKNVLAADFPWRREDPRSNRELLDVLKSTKPIAMSIPHPQNGIDPWRTAFDALLSKPENVTDAWKLRYLDDVRGSHFAMGISSGIIVYAAELTDEKAKPHFVVINYHPSAMPYGIFACYIFSPNGRFDYGAILLGPYRTGGLPLINLQPGSKGLTIWFEDGSRKAYGILKLERDGVIIHDADVMNGSYLGIPLYRTETLLN